jgi:hypothetical protein
MYLASLIAIAATMWFYYNLKNGRRRQDYVQNTERASLHYSPVQIICGDCSGEGVSPRKTFMDRSGKCDHCGGASYVLASERGLMMRRSMAQRGLYVVASDASEKPHTEPVAEPVTPLKIAV